MKKKVDKNLVLMDDILEVIGQSDEWEDIQLHDPRIVAANKALKAEMEALQLPFNEYCGLKMAIGQATATVIDAAILYGIHVAFALQDVVGRIPDLSRHIMQRTGGVAE